jgi:hypothetical protein
MGHLGHVYKIAFSASSFAHSFGHDVFMNGLLPSRQTVAAHLVLTLDMTDPKLASLGVDVGPVLRLVHPFRYSQGQYFRYRHRSNGDIEFTGQLDVFGQVPELDWPVYDYPFAFEKESIDLYPVPPSSCFDPTMSLIGHCQPLPESDDYTSMTCGGCVGSAVDTRPDWWLAVPSNRLKLLAIVAGEPKSSLMLWGEYGRFVSTLFWYCPNCKEVTTHSCTD